MTHLSVLNFKVFFIIILNMKYNSSTCLKSSLVNCFVNYQYQKYILYISFIIFISLSVTSVVLLARQHVFFQELPSLDPLKKISQYVFQRWTMDDGLPSNSVRAFAQTTDGYLWLGTYGGLVRFDGITFSSFNRDNTPQFKHNKVNTLLAGKDGDLWIGTNDDGLLYYKRGKFLKYSSQDGLESDNVRCLLMNERGYLFIGTDRGVTVFDNKTMSPLSTVKKIPRVNALYETPDGTVWIGSEVEGLFSFKNGKFRAYKNLSGFPAKRIVGLQEDKEGCLLIATFAYGLFRYNSGTFTNVLRFDNVAIERMYNLFKDRAGSIWLATNDGMCRYYNKKIDLLDDENLIGDKRIRAFFEDREGNLWVASYNGGLCVIKEGHLVSITRDEGMPKNHVWSVYNDSKDRIWLGFGPSGISRIENDGNITNYSINEGLPDYNVRCFSEDRAGNLWIGTTGGIIRFNNDKFKTIYDTTNGLPDNHVRCLLEPSNEPGTILAGLTEGGIVRLNENQNSIQSVFAGSSLDSATCNWIVEDKTNAGLIWIGANGGLIRLQGDNYSLITISEGLPVNHLRAGYSDPDGLLWLGTDGGGICLYRNETNSFKTFNTSDGLLDDSIWSVIIDEHSMVWMSCDRGIFSIHKQDFLEYQKGKMGILKPTLYGKSDGMKSTECNSSGNPVAFRPMDKTIWYPTTVGAVIIKPGKKRRKTLPPTVHMEDIQINRQSVRLAKTFEGKVLKLDADSKDFEFHYTALNYSNPLGIRFKYKLDGHDGDWVNAGTRRSAYYSNLSPGKYIFNVMAVNSEGVWNVNKAEAGFYLPPRFYQTWWFQILSILVLIFIMYSGYKIRVRNIEARNQQLLKEIRERITSQKETAHLRNLLQNMIDFMPSIMIGVDNHGQVNHWNLEAEKSMGISAKKAYGRKLEDVFPPFAVEFKDIIPALKEEKSVIKKRITVKENAREKTGTRYFDVTIYPLNASDGTGAVIRIDDVTESQIKDAQLRQAQKMESVGILAGGLAHDFNNILSGILGTLSMAKHRLNKHGHIDKDKLLEFFSMMGECGSRATSMVKQLLTLSREQPLTFLPVDLNKTVKHVMKICENSLHKSVKLCPEFHEKPSMVKADPAQIEQVLLNLCINADHAMTLMHKDDENWGGRLTVSLKQISPSKEFLTKHPEAEEKEYWQLSVADEGIGMDSETAAKIFTPFYTKKEKSQGTGLGLSMAYNIVKQHNGFINFKSQPGKGTTFYIYLPIFMEKSRQLGKQNTDTEILMGEGLILVADDEKIMRKIARFVLKECGYNVITVENGKQCVQEFKKRRKEIRAVLLDMAMPEMSGKEAYFLMKQMEPNVKVLLASGSRKDSRIDDVLQSGCGGFIQKPFTMSKLSIALHQIIYGKSEPKYTSVQGI